VLVLLLGFENRENADLAGAPGVGKTNRHARERFNPTGPFLAVFVSESVWRSWRFNPSGPLLGCGALQVGRAIARK
jgi:hypothetical protein